MITNHNSIFERVPCRIENINTQWDKVKTIIFYLNGPVLFELSGKDYLFIKTILNVDPLDHINMPIYPEMAITHKIIPYNNDDILRITYDVKPLDIVNMMYPVTIYNRVIMPVSCDRNIQKILIPKPSKSASSVSLIINGNPQLLTGCINQYDEYVVIVLGIIVKTMQLFFDELEYDGAIILVYDVMIKINDGVQYLI